MERIDRILAHPEHLKSLARVKKLEKTREFCRHGMRHLLDVSRIGYIMVLEEGLPVPKDIMYAAGLLHDVGKYVQYETGIPHPQAGAELADGILKDCGYSEEERRLICRAIANHSRKGGVFGDVSPDSLDSVLYRADKASRNCFRCKKKEQCDWAEELKQQGFIC